jgi:HK97 gp10 family phage protein
VAAPLLAALSAASALVSRTSLLVAQRGIAAVTRAGVQRAATDTVGLQQRLGESLKRSGIMPGVNIKTLGLQETVKYLRTMRDVTKKRVVRAAARQAANVMAAQVKATTYDDNSRKRRTGLMASAVRVTTKVKGETVQAFVTPSKRGQRTPFYWWFLERGTATRATRKGASRGAIFPRPWVAPAANATQARALARFASVLKSGVERESKKRGG